MNEQYKKIIAACEELSVKSLLFVARKEKIPVEALDNKIIQNVLEKYSCGKERDVYYNALLGASLATLLVIINTLEMALSGKRAIDELNLGDLSE